MLLSALVVGVVLTLGQVPLAVSQPVAIQAKMIKGPIPMDGANPIWENVPGVVVPLTGQTITTPMHPNIAVKSVFVKAVTNGKVHGAVRRHGEHLAVECRMAEGPRKGRRWNVGRGQRIPGYFLGLLL
jgi:hypothetical protein